MPRTPRHALALLLGTWALLPAHAASAATVYAYCTADNNALRPGHEWISNVFAADLDQDNSLRGRTTSFRKAVAARSGIEVGGVCVWEDSWQQAEDSRNDRIAFHRQNGLPFSFINWP